MAYPTIRYFNPNPGKHTGTNFLRTNDVQRLKSYFIEKLEETQRKGIPSALCYIKPYEEKNVVLDSNYMLTFIMIDKPNNNRLAQEIVMDYCPVKKVKIIYTLNTNTPLTELLKTEIYPSFYRVESNNQFTFLASGNNKTEYIDIINSELKTMHMTPFNIIEITTQLYNKLFQKDIVSENDVNIIFLSDLEATLKFSLDHEIVSRSVISDDALKAFKSYLELLVEYFPSSIKGKKFIKLISDIVHHNKTVYGEQLGKFINKYEMFLHPYVTKLNWIGCEGSQQMYRRYPCGLWTLFHTLTVQAANKNSNVFNGVSVLETIAGYVKHFFGCTECSEHFIQMTTSIKNNVSSLDDAVLWLWSAHNKVNQRLKGDVTEDPEHPKLIFPSKLNCETCRMNGTDEWNNTEVLMYLKKKYSTISIKQTPNDYVHSQPQSMLSSKVIIEDNNYNKVDEEEWKIDISTCMISYILSCSVLMVLFYLLVVKKRCKKNKYIYFILGKF